MKAHALVLLVPLMLAACDRSPSFEHTNATTDAQLNAIAANTSDTAGAAGDASGAAEVGEQVRSQAASPPPPQPR